MIQGGYSRVHTASDSPQSRSFKRNDEKGAARKRQTDRSINVLMCGRTELDGDNLEFRLLLEV